MPGEFPCDVFLSHSAKDTPVVRDVAERLKKDGLRVWFDEWEIKLGDSIERTSRRLRRSGKGWGARKTRDRHSPIVTQMFACASGTTHTYAERREIERSYRK